MADDFPEWAGRQVLAESLRAVGLPVVFAAFWHPPRDTMTYSQRLQAIAIVGQVLHEARRRLPAAVSGAVLDRGWRDSAWRCTVAGLAELSRQPAQPQACAAPPAGEQSAAHKAPAARQTPQPRPAPSTGPAAPVVIRRRVAEAPATSALPAQTGAVGFTIRRAEGVRRAG